MGQNDEYSRREHELALAAVSAYAPVRIAEKKAEAEKTNHFFGPKEAFDDFTYLYDHALEQYHGNYPDND